MRTIIAIDPGASGGIAVLYPDGKAMAMGMPDTQGDVVCTLQDIKENAARSGSELIAVLELVSGFAGVKQPGSAAFKFGENFGFIKGCLQMASIRVEQVRPQVWQKCFGVGTASACATKTIWKNKLKALAQRLFPSEKVTLKTADALLILEYYKNNHP